MLYEAKKKTSTTLRETPPSSRNFPLIIISSLCLKKKKKKTEKDLFHVLKVDVSLWKKKVMKNKLNNICNKFEYKII